MSKPICPTQPETGPCPGIEDSAHKAQYMHRCPYSAPCPKAHVPEHQQDFYHLPTIAAPQHPTPMAMQGYPVGVQVMPANYGGQPTLVSSTSSNLTQQQQQQQLVSAGFVPFAVGQPAVGQQQTMFVGAPTPGQPLPGGVSPWGPAPVQLPPQAPIPYGYAPVGAAMAPPMPYPHMVPASTVPPPPTSPWPQPQPQQQLQQPAVGNKGAKAKADVAPPFPSLHKQPVPAEAEK